jgi:hypothetical protein
MELKYLELNGFRPDLLALLSLGVFSHRNLGLEIVLGEKGQLKVLKGTSWEVARRRV